MHQSSLLPDCSLPHDTVIPEAVAAPAQTVAVASILRGRRAVHADAAARVRAHRANKTRLDYTDKPEIAGTIGEIAEQLGCSRNEVMQSMVRFALTNRNWKQVGLYGSKGLAS